MSAPTAQPLALRHIVPLFLYFALAYFLSYGLRTVNATLSPYLADDLALSAADLGWLSSSYFVAFAALQWPLGIWLDRYGARRVEAGLLAIAAIGALLLALSPSLAWAATGRLLIGLGVAACLMAPYAYFRRCFPPDRQAQLSLWMLVAGTSGAVFSTLPTGMLAEWLGWRSVFFVCAAGLLVAALLIYWRVPDADLASANAPSATDAPAPAFLNTPLMIRVLPVALLGQGALSALQTLWIGPWLTNVLGLPPPRMASALFVITTLLMVGYIAMSFIGPWLQRRGVSLVQVGIRGHQAAVLALVLAAVLPGWWGGIWWLVLMLAIPATSLLQPATAAAYPRSVAGRVLTTFNLFIFSGAFLVQWGFGVVVDLLQAQGMAETTAFRVTLFSLSLPYLATLVWFHRYRGRPERSRPAA